ncbi:MAG: ABC transporter permease [Planctomycetota bacterium]
MPRLLDAVAEASGKTWQPDLDGPTRLRQAFAWYYEEGGGYRVQNTGEKPWGGLLAGDLGSEMQNDAVRIGPELWRRIKVSLPLSLISVILAYVLALPLGIFSARNHGKKRDGLITILLFVLFAIPTFWAGLMLVQLFGITKLDWLPVVGLHDKDYDTMGWWARQWDLLLHCILPIATMTYGSLAYLSRQMRAGMMEVIRQDYIRTARAKGLSEDVVIYKHALRNSMIPVITLLASILPVLIGGSIIVEKVFEIPGMGRYAFEGLSNRDFNVLMATTILVGVMTQVGILLSDITYTIVDPRIRHD